MIRPVTSLILVTITIMLVGCRNGQNSDEVKQVSDVIVYRESVAKGGYTETVGCNLKDGRYFKIKCDDKAWLEIHDLPEDAPLSLQYSTGRGLQLVNPVTGHSFWIYKLFRTDDRKCIHPVDTYSESIELDITHQTTQGYAELSSQQADLWLIEVDRLEKEILSRPYLKGEIRENFIKLIKVRRDYYERQITFYAKSTYFSPLGGSIRTLECGVFAANTARSLAFDLMELTDKIDAFDKLGE